MLEHHLKLKKETRLIRNRTTSAAAAAAAAAADDKCDGDHLPKLEADVVNEARLWIVRCGDS